MSKYFRDFIIKRQVKGQNIVSFWLHCLFKQVNKFRFSLLKDTIILLYLSGVYCISCDYGLSYTGDTERAADINRTSLSYKWMSMIGWDYSCVKYLWNKMKFSWIVFTFLVNLYDVFK